MILYKLVKNNNKKFPGTYGKYYARPAVTATISIDQLAEHMSSHNTPFSAGAVRGILTDMVTSSKALPPRSQAAPQAEAPLPHQAAQAATHQEAQAATLPVARMPAAMESNVLTP